MRFRKGDFLAVGIVILAAVVLSVTVLPALTAQDAAFARVYRDGECVREVPLSVNQTFSVVGDYTNTVCVRDGKIAVIHADCPNNDCVRQGWLSDGGAIVCLPNGVEIRLTGDVDMVVP